MVVLKISAAKHIQTISHFLEKAANIPTPQNKSEFRVKELLFPFSWQEGNN